MVDHPVEDLGFEVEIVAFLAGMGHREELGDLVLAIVQHRLEVSEGLRFDTGEEPGDRRFHFHADSPDIDRAVPAGSFDHVREQFPGNG